MVIVFYLKYGDGLINQCGGVLIGKWKYHAPYKQE
jgi:hypothetical protein